MPAEGRVRAAGRRTSGGCLCTSTHLSHTTPIPRGVAEHQPRAVARVRYVRRDELRRVGRRALLTRCWPGGRSAARAAPVFRRLSRWSRPRRKKPTIPTRSKGARGCLENRPTARTDPLAVPKAGRSETVARRKAYCGSNVPPNASGTLHECVTRTRPGEPTATDELRDRRCRRQYADPGAVTPAETGEVRPAALPR